MKKQYVLLITICSVLITSFVMSSKTNSYKEMAVKTEQSNKKLRTKVQILKERNSELSSKTKNKDNSSKGSTTNDKEMNLNDEKLKLFLTLMLNYDNSSFVSRFKNAKNYASEQPISVFQITKGNVEAPKTTVSSKVTDYKFYPDVNSNGTKGIAVVKVNFNYQGQTQHNVNEYDVTLAEDGTVTKLAQRIVQNNAN